MTDYDVFNGDADGMCALLQLRLARPVNSQLITGVKRDIQLLQQVDAQAGDNITVLDISLRENYGHVLRLLDQGAHFFYCDHHQAGDIPQHKHFVSTINTDANVCTSLLINGYLQGRFPLWAITGAFGDNLRQSALLLAQSQSLSTQQIAQLEQLGVHLNYNAYGDTLADLHFHPALLYQILVNYHSPLDFIAQEKVVLQQLMDAYQDDSQKAHQQTAAFENAYSRVFILPDSAWARRISGVYANDLANAAPDKAHAVLSLQVDGSYRASVRAPLNNKRGAATVCNQFASGGGREAAAGINRLLAADLSRFIDTMSLQYANH